MEARKKETRPRVYRVALPDGQVVLFMPCPRKVKGTRGHNPDNHYAARRSPMRDARRQIGPISGRQWVKFRKFGSKAYRAFKNQQTMGGIINDG